jgi:hypothetical protein
MFGRPVDAATKWAYAATDTIRSMRIVLTNFMDVLFTESPLSPQACDCPHIVMACWATYGVEIKYERRITGAKDPEIEKTSRR